LVEAIDADTGDLHIRRDQLRMVRSSHSHFFQGQRYQLPDPGTYPATDERAMFCVSHGPIPLCIVLWSSMPAYLLQPGVKKQHCCWSMDCGCSTRSGTSWYLRACVIQDTTYVLPTKPGVKDGCAALFGVP
jgi:hypothetical protein